MFHSLNQRRLTALISLFLAIPAVARASAQGFLEAGRPTVRNYLASEYQGRAQNMVVVQDSRGLFYFGNWAQVLEFDGETWRGIPIPHAAHVRALGLTTTIAYMWAVSTNWAIWIRILKVARRSSLWFTPSALNFGELWVCHHAARRFYNKPTSFPLGNNSYGLAPAFRLTAFSQWLGDFLYVTCPASGC
jgi:hypothetical protein